MTHSKNVVQRFFGVIEWGLERIENFFVIVGLVGLFLMMLLTTLNAGGRYLFNSPVPGVYETTELYLMPMAIFLVAASLQRDDGNINVDIAYQNFSDRTQTIIDLLSRIATMAIFGIIAWEAAKHAWDGYQRGWVTVGIVDFPIYLSWAIMAIGLTTFCIRLLFQIRDDTKELIL